MPIIPRNQWRLPRTTSGVFDPQTEEPKVAPLPAALTNGFITFGCLNNFCKVNDSVPGVVGEKCCNG